MSGKYWDVSWNVVTGCTPVSEACEHCWAEPMLLHRLAKAHPHKYPRGFRPTFHPDELTKPLHWKKPRTVFVAILGDLFHEQITDEQLDQVFAVMALTPQHRYLLCTKRPERMAEYLEGARDRVAAQALRMRTDKSPIGPLPHGKPGAKWWPLKNVWCGFTAETQARLDERAPHVMRLAKAGWHTWVSLEPLLGEMWLDDYLPCPGIKWVVCGGETGKGARLMAPNWARYVRDACDEEVVPFWFKQWGPQGAGRLLCGYEHNGRPW